MKKKKVFKRVVATLLSVAMLAMSTPEAAFAEGIKASEITVDQDTAEQADQDVTVDIPEDVVDTLEEDEEETEETDEATDEESDTSEVITEEETVEDTITLGDSSDEVLYADATPVTRIEWFSKLIDYFSLTTDVDSYPDNYYSDISSTYAKYKQVMIATDYGLVDVYPGSAFNPDDPITREDAAHTLNLCLGYVLESSEYTFSDSASCYYKDDEQVAVNMGWFALIDGAFVPTRAVTSAEFTSIFSLVDSALSEEQITGENTYDYNNDVKMLPEGTEIETLSENEIKIIDCPISLEEGDVFGIVYDGMPLAWTVSSAEYDGDDLVVTTGGLDYDEAFDTINYQASAEVNLEDIETLSDTATLYYSVGGTEEENYTDGQLYEDYDTAALLGIDAIVIEDTEHINNASAEVNGVTVKYDISISDFKYDWGATKKSVNLNVNFKLKATYEVEGDLNKMLDKDIELAKIPICPGLYYVPAIGLEIKGSVKTENSYTCESKLSWTAKNGMRFKPSCRKDSSTFTGEVKGKLGVKVSIKADLFVMSASVYFAFGLCACYRSVTYGDGNAPAKCTNLAVYLYLEIGYKLSVGAEVGDWKLTIYEHKDALEIYNEENSPIKVAVHKEDGVQVSACTCKDRFDSGSDDGGSVGYVCSTSGARHANSSGAGYFSPLNSQYYYDYSNNKMGSGDSAVTVFTYTLNSSTNYATITGYNGTARTVYIPETIDDHQVDAIGNNAFKGKNIVSVYFPDTVTVIGQTAFMNCTKLATVDLPSQLKTIKYGAFQGCTSLTSIEIPKSLDAGDHYNDSYGVFKNTGLKKVTFEDGITSIPTELFGLCESLESITIPSTVDTIESDAFYKCTSLKSISMPSSVTTVASGAFNGCSSLTSVSIGKYVTSLGDKAFKDCIKLQMITIPDRVTSIGDYTFQGCKILSDVKLSKRLTTLGYGTFQDCTALTDITIPKSLQKGEKFNESSGIFMNSGLKNVSFEAGTTLIATDLFANCDSLEEIEIPSTVTAIKAEAFYNCTSLKKIVIPDSVTSMEYKAFSKCKSVESISIGSGVTSLPQWAFNSCLKLTSVVIPDNVTVIGPEAFMDCNTLSSVKLSENLQSIEYGAFQGCTKLEEITIPKSLTKGDKYNDQYGIFKNSGLKTVYFETGTTLIPEELFALCGSLEEIVIPSTVKTIGSYAFYHCTGLKRIIIPDSVTTINDKAFAGCTYLTNVSFGKSVTKLGNYVFQGCTKLKIIRIPVTVTSIGTTIFKDCSYLTKVANESAVSISLPDTTGFIWMDRKTGDTITAIASGTAIRDDYDEYTDAEVDSVSLSITNDIIVNFYLYLSDTVTDGGYITLNGSKYTIPTAESDGTYKFSIAVSAKNLGNTIKIVAYDADKTAVDFSNGNATDGVYTCTARDYINKMKSGDDATSKLAYALDAYGLHAQKYFDYNTPDVVPDVTTGDFSKYAMTTSGTLPDGLEYVGSSLILTDQTTIRHYFKTSNAISTYTFTIAGKKLKPATREGMYYVEVTKISPFDYDEMYTLSVSDGTSTQNISYSVFSYCGKVISNSKNEKLKNLINTMYSYWQAAENCK